LMQHQKNKKKNHKKKKPNISNYQPNNSLTKYFVKLIEKKQP